MDNYPPGAANDPRAPYNQEEMPEVEVRAKTVLIKEQVIQSAGGHYVQEWDYDPVEGRSVCTSFYEVGDLEDDFRNEGRTAIECLRDCEKVLKELVKEKRTFYANIYIPNLLSDIDGWEEEEFNVEEI